MREIPELNKQELRQFGLILSGIVAFLFGLVIPLIRDFSLPLWPWLVGGVLFLWSMILPVRLRLLYRGWMRLTVVIDSVLKNVGLALVFYVVMLPIGFVMRAIGRDPMMRRFDRESDTYRIISNHVEKDHITRPY